MELAVTKISLLNIAQVHSNGSKGDMAESFAFATLFPNVLQPPVSVISNMIFRWTQRSNIFLQIIEIFSVFW